MIIYTPRKSEELIFSSSVRSLCPYVVHQTKKNEEHLNIQKKKLMYEA